MDERRPSGDRERKDGTTRDRVDEIAAAMDTYRQALDRRYRFVVVAVMVMIVAMILASVAGYAIVQGQRWEQTRDACLRTNAQTEATVGLLNDLGARQRAIDFAKIRYPHVPPLAHREGDEVVEGAGKGYDGAMTCDEFASDHVRGPRL